MKTKTWTVLYWVVAVFFCGSMLMAGISGLLQTEESKAMMGHLGYPAHFLVVNGIAKVLGALALLQTRFRTIREWAFAGFTINMLGAAAAWVAAGDGLSMVVTPLVALGVVLLFYFLWKKKEQLSAQSRMVASSHDATRLSVTPDATSTQLA
ncbi:DoxX family protein [Hymenobacter tibetensis]|uniref:DoxX family protein n=1 Tax=Hymenobacter tibetensis TaxID=497967 RepID=A0ABY4D3D6_9BACT|nr:DoxX family protein [Hymenobacter tibetensis]UOG74468.1 DoxX family protein [Hymenobacter tibetensis]